MSNPTCQAVRKDGSPCRAPALPDSALCWSHDPRQAEAAARARAEGGAKASRLRSLEGKRRRLDSPRALAGFLSTLIHDALEGKVDADLARTVGYLAAVQVKAVELAQRSELEARLAEVERLLAQRRPA